MTSQKLVFRLCIVSCVIFNRMLPNSFHFHLNTLSYQTHFCDFNCGEECSTINCFRSFVFVLQARGCRSGTITEFMSIWVSKRFYISDEGDFELYDFYYYMFLIPRMCFDRFNKHYRHFLGVYLQLHKIDTDFFPRVRSHSKWAITKTFWTKGENESTTIFLTHNFLGVKNDYFP